MVTQYDLVLWGLPGSNCSERDIKDINNSVDQILASMSLRGCLDPKVQMELFLRRHGEGNERPPSQAYREHEKQITKNYFLVRGIKNNNIREVQAAISVGADVSEVCICAGSRITPIVSAAVSGSLDIVKKLVDAGADINQRKMNGESALSDAVYFNYYEIAEYLLERGADPNIVAYEGLTPLAVSENARMVKLLLAYGADPNIPDAEGDLPIVARIDNGDYESVRLLIDAGTDLDKKNNFGESARARAARVSFYYPQINELF